MAWMIHRQRMQIPSSLLLIPRKPVIRLDKIQPMTREELGRFLSDDSYEVQRAARELWQRHAARKTLIDFESGNANQTIRLQP